MLKTEQFLAVLEKQTFLRISCIVIKVCNNMKVSKWLFSFMGELHL